MKKFERKLLGLTKRYAAPLTFAAGALTVIGYTAERLTGWKALIIAAYLVATVLAGLPILFKALTGFRLLAGVCQAQARFSAKEPNRNRTCPSLVK